MSRIVGTGEGSSRSADAIPSPDRFAPSVADGRNGFLSDQYFAANGAVLAFCETGFRAGGLHGSVAHFGVALGGYHFLGNQHFITDGTVLAFGEAGFRAGGLHGSVDHFSVALGGYHFLGNQHFITDGTVLAFCQTGLRAGGFHSCIDHFGVALGGNHFLSDQHFITDGAVFAFRQTGLRAGGFHSCIDHFGVALGGNHFLSDQNFTADGAVFAFRQTGFRAGRRHSGVNHLGVAGGVDRNRLGINKFLPVECKNCGVNGLTGRRAGRSSEFSIDYRLDCLYVSAMHAAEDRVSGGVIIRPGPFRSAVFVEYRGVGGVAGHGGDFRIPIREGVGVAVIISLDGSLVSGRFAVFITLSSLYAVDKPGYRVTIMFVLGIGEGLPIDFHSGRINGISHMFATPLCLRDRRVDSLRVGLIVLAGEACAGGFIILAPGPDRFAPGMTKGGQGFSFSLRTNRAGAGLDACLCTGRRSLNDPFAPIVACCGDFLVSAVVAAGAGVVGLPADFRTACGLCVVMNEVVSEGGDGSSLHSLTDGTGTSLFTVFGAGGCCNHGPIAEAVSGCGNGLLRACGILRPVEIHDSGMNDFPVRRAGDCSCCLAGDLGVHNFGVIRLGGAGKRRGGGGVIIRPGPGGFPEAMGDDPEVSAEGSPIGNVAVFEINRDAAGMRLVHRVLVIISVGIPSNNAVFIYVNDLDLVPKGKLGLKHQFRGIAGIDNEFLILVNGVDVPAGPDQIVAVGQCAGIGRSVFRVASDRGKSRRPTREGIGAVVAGLHRISAGVRRSHTVFHSIFSQQSAVDVLPSDGIAPGRLFVHSNIRCWDGGGNDVRRPLLEGIAVLGVSFLFRGTMGGNLTVSDLAGVDYAVVIVHPGDDNHLAFRYGNNGCGRRFVIGVIPISHVVGSCCKVGKGRAGDRRVGPVFGAAVLHIRIHAGDTAVPLPLIGFSRCGQAGGSFPVCFGDCHNCAASDGLIVFLLDLVPDRIGTGVGISRVFSHIAAVLRSAVTHGRTLRRGHDNAVGAAVIVAGIAFGVDRHIRRLNDKRLRIVSRQCVVSGLGSGQRGRGGILARVGLSAAHDSGDLVTANLTGQFRRGSVALTVISEAGIAPDQAQFLGGNVRGGHGLVSVGSQHIVGNAGAVKGQSADGNRLVSSDVGVFKCAAGSNGQGITVNQPDEFCGIRVQYSVCTAIIFLIGSSNPVDGDALLVNGQRADLQTGSGVVFVALGHVDLDGVAAGVCGARNLGRTLPICDCNVAHAGLAGHSRRLSDSVVCVAVISDCEIYGNGVGLIQMGMLGVIPGVTIRTVVEVRPCGGPSCRGVLFYDVISGGWMIGTVMKFCRSYRNFIIIVCPCLTTVLSGFV